MKNSYSQTDSSVRKAWLKGLVVAACCSPLAVVAQSGMYNVTMPQQCNTVTGGIEIVTFPNTPANASGDATLTITSQGDLDLGTEFLRFFGEVGPQLGQTSSTTQCSGIATNIFTIPAADINAWAASMNNIEITADAEPSVNVLGTCPCGPSSSFGVTMTLEYPFQTFPNCEDFESGAAGWTTGGTQNEWHLATPANPTINTAAPGGSKSWITDSTGSYEINGLSWVQSPLMDFSDLVDPIVRMDVWWESEFSWDGANLQSSIDNGATWQTIGAFGDPNNWYTDNDIDGLAASGSDEGWSGAGLNGSGGWVLAENDLSGLAGEDSVNLRFVFGSDASQVDDGFAFDNVSIGESNDVVAVDLFAPDSICGLDSTSLTMVIFNNSLDDKVNIPIMIDSSGTFVSMFTYPDTLRKGETDTVVIYNFSSSLGGNITWTAWTAEPGDVNIFNDTVSIDRVYFPVPSATISGGGTICEGETAPVSISLNGTGPWDILYTDGNGNNTAVPNQATSPFNFAVNTSGTYTVITVLDAAGCSAQPSQLTGSAVVVVNPSPTVDLGNDTTACGALTLDAGAGFSNYTWSTGETSQTISTDQPGIVSVTVTDGNGCTGTDEIDLNVNPLPPVNLGNDTSICEGGEVVLSATGTGIIGIEWQDGSTGPIFTATSVGAYSVTVTDINGCTNSGTVSILTVNPAPVVDLGGDQSILNGNSATLDAGAGFSGYEWSTGETTQSISVSNQGAVSVTVTDGNGCTASDTATIFFFPVGVNEIGQTGYVRYYPNPTNGQLNMEVTGLENQDADLTIVNVHGQVVLSERLTNLSGTYLRQFDLSDQASGIYFVRLKTAEGLAVQRISLQ